MEKPLLYHEHARVEFKSAIRPPSNSKLSRIRTPVLGSYYHAILNAFSPFYRNCKNDRSELVTTLRAELAEKLVTGEPKPYDTLYEGNLAALAKRDKRWSAETLQQEIRTGSGLNPVIHELISNIFDIDIYIIDLNREKLVAFNKAELLYRKRTSIVLFTVEGHYEPCSLSSEDGTPYTYFKHDHPFILTLSNSSK